MNFTVTQSLHRSPTQCCICTESQTLTRRYVDTHKELKFPNQFKNRNKYLYICEECVKEMYVALWGYEDTTVQETNRQLAQAEEDLDRTVGLLEEKSKELELAQDTQVTDLLARIASTAVKTQESSRAPARRTTTTRKTPPKKIDG